MRSAAQHEVTIRAQAIAVAARKDKQVARRHTTQERFEQAKALQGESTRSKPSQALVDHCQQIRDEVGIPLGLWAVVTDRITAHQFGNALLEGHEELLEPIEELVG